MSDNDFKMMVYLFVLFPSLFLNSYYNANPQHLSFNNDIENLENYPWGINMYKVLLRKWELYKGSMSPSGGDGNGRGEGKAKLMYMMGCFLILQVFAIEHIPASRTYLISVSVKGYLSAMP